jgi:hypothetical protein
MLDSACAATGVRVRVFLCERACLAVVSGRFRFLSMGIFEAGGHGCLM